MPHLTSSIRVLEALPRAANPSLTLYWVDANGAVTNVVGERDDAQVVLDAETLRCESPSGRRSVAFRLGEQRAAVTFDPSQAEHIEPLLQSLRSLVDDHGRLVQDLQSMESRSAFLMEEVSLVSETLPKLPTGESETQTVEMALRALVIAAGVERALYCRLHRETNEAEVVVHVAMESGERDATPKPYPLTPLVPVAEGLLGRAAAGPDHGVLAKVAELVRAPAAPESLAREHVIAVPVRYGSGDDAATLGVLFAMDRRKSSYASGDLGNEEVALTAAVACMLGSVLGTRRAAELHKEMENATEIQRQIRPEHPRAVRGFDLAGDCRTCGAVGGDYYDFVPIARGGLLAVLADVSGHNLASGMLMVSARTALRVLAARQDRIEAVFDELARALHDDLMRTERFISAVGIMLRPGEGRVRIVNAGHCPPLIYRARTRKIEEVPSQDPILGLVPGIQHSADELQLEGGDMILLYTDGITEATDASGQMFGEERLRAVIARAATGSAKQLLEQVFLAVDQFTNLPRSNDDISALVIRAVPGPGGAP